jgi:hypothetical protein
MKPLHALAIASLLLIAPGFAYPEEEQDDPKPRVSPHDAVHANVDDAQIVIVYGRPYTKDPKTGQPRKIWGGLVPFGTVWRTGADEATLLTTSKPLVFGETEIPAGTYSLFTLPQEKGTAKLIINKQKGQWGTKYDETQDLARVDMTQSTLDQPVDQFTIALGRNQAGGVLKLMWEKTQYSVSFTVKK